MAPQNSAEGLRDAFQKCIEKKTTQKQRKVLLGQRLSESISHTEEIGSYYLTHSLAP